MSLILHVAAEKWRTHLATVVANSEAQVVPVIKGNGYGFGIKVLAQEAKNLNLPVVAVATIAEAEEVQSVFPGEILLLSPSTHSDGEKWFTQFHRTLRFFQQRCQKSLSLSFCHRFTDMVFRYLI